jgi:O-antigen/teichoic acid export membrane protein
MKRETQAIRSGSLVAINHVVGAAITVISALLLSKALGPRDFAIYALCSSLSGVLRGVSRLGVNAYLLTQKEEPRAEDYHTALATMLACSVVVACAASVALPWLGHFSRVPRLFWPGIATVALLPFHVLPLPALARMERQLKFKPVVIIELLGQVIGQFTGISLAFCGWGIWGPLTGWGVRAIFQGVAPWVVVRLRPRIHWDTKNTKRMIKYGVGYVLTTSLAQSRSLVLLAIVGRLMGQDAVGYMGLTLRAIGLAAPFRAAVSRVILPAIAPIAHISDTLKERIKATVEMELLLSIPVIVFAVAIYPFFIRLMLGPSWQPTATLFPWVAAGFLLASAHAASMSALHVRGFFAESIASTIIGYVALAVALVVFGSFMGLEGCAVATVAVWPASWANEWFSKRRLGTRWSMNGVVWAVGGAGACLAWRCGPWMLIIPAIICVATHAAIQSRTKVIINAFFSEA